MKKLTFMLACTGIMLLASSSASAQSSTSSKSSSKSSILSSVLSSVANKKSSTSSDESSSNSSTSSTSSTSSSGSGILSNVLSSVTNSKTVANTISSVIGLNKLTAENLVGTWKYSEPGVAFSSEELLAKAGGEVAATQVREKLVEPYQKVGISSSNTQFTFNEDGTFKSTIAGKSFNGKYTFDESTNELKLKATLITLNGYATRSGTSGVSVLFESKKILTLLQTVASLSGNSTLSTIGDLSTNYDGVRVGFDLEK